MSFTNQTMKEKQISLQPRWCSSCLQTPTYLFWSQWHFKGHLQESLEITEQKLSKIHELLYNVEENCSCYVNLGSGTCCLDFRDTKIFKQRLVQNSFTPLCVYVLLINEARWRNKLANKLNREFCGVSFSLQNKQKKSLFVVMTVIRILVMYLQGI